MPADGGSSGGLPVTSIPKPKKQASAVRTTRKVSRSSGGGSGSSGSSRSSGGGSNYSRSRSSYNPSTPSPAPRPKPKPPSLATYLGGDDVYQGAVRGGKRSLADFLSETGRRRGEANTTFKQTQASMERDRTQQLEALRDEFASRGLIQSGIYGQEQGRFQEQFAQQLTGLMSQQKSLLADLLSQETNYKRENQLALEAARQEALQRRAAKYNIGG